MGAATPSNPSPTLAFPCMVNPHVKPGFFGSFNQTTRTTYRMGPKEPVDISTFATTQLALLDQELQIEIQETSALVSNHSPTGLQRSGVAITNLVVSSQRTGLGGKTVLELSPDTATSATGELPEHGVRAGDIVLVAEQPAGSAKKREMHELEKKGARGVVTKVQKAHVSVALDEGKEDVAFPGRIWIVKLADEVTHRR